MEMFRKIFYVALLAGLGAGLFVTVIHEVATVPVILEAETLEKAGDAAPAADQATTVESAEHQHEAEAWEPTDGFERSAFTVLADILTGVGFALLLVAAYALWGGEMDWRKGLYWGLAGFATFTLAPGLGLPPEVPGTEAAPLLDRQLWWVVTVLATGGGLALVFFARQALWVIAGIVLIVLPHAYGAPQPTEYKGLAPASVAHQFIVAVVITSLLFWLALGMLTGFFYKRIAQPS